MDFGSIWETIQGFLLWLWEQWQTQTLVYLIGGNFIVAVLVSIVTGKFRLGKFGEVLYKKVLPWLAVYAFFSFTGETLELEWVAITAWGLLTGQLLADLLESLGELGIFKKDTPVVGLLAKIPDQLKK